MPKLWKQPEEKVNLKNQESWRVFWFDFFRCLLFSLSVFLIFLARSTPRPLIFERSATDALNTCNGVPNFSSIRTAVFSPTPGKLHKIESCCFSISTDFFIFFRCKFLQMWHCCVFLPLSMVSLFFPIFLCDRASHRFSLYNRPSMIESPLTADVLDHRSVHDL